MRWLFALCLLLLAGTAQAGPELRFSITEGRIQNDFFRDGDIAAHLVAKSGDGARLVVAFPAGNSGVGLWFEEATNWSVSSAISGHRMALADGGVRRGIVAELASSTHHLTIKRALLGSVRVLRDYGYANPIPSSVEATPTIAGNKVIWERRRIDGDPGYYQALEVLNGRVGIDANGVVHLSADAPVRLRYTALTGDRPLSPIPAAALLKPVAGTDPQLRQALTFLSYDEKLLAGSWQYNTYFGRDTLMSLRLLMPVLKPRAIEAGLSSVLLRLDANGEVAHEEDVGEFALLARAGEGEELSDAPRLDYKMVDDDFMLAPIMAHYLLETAEGRRRARAFLARQGSDGTSFGALLARNLNYVATRARPFSADPAYSNLIGLHDGLTVGEWRDSQLGLGGDGRYPYDINAALVPAALQAADKLYASGLLQPYSGQRPADLDAMASVWQNQAPRLFAVALSRQEASDRLGRFVAAGQWAAPVDAKETAFYALALDQAGKTIPVMHSDIGFALLFTQPREAELAAALSSTMQPFPKGLLSSAGMFVANPAYAEPPRYAVFDRSRYHGTVIWSWHQAMMLAGVDRQLLRRDLAKATVSLLRDARARLRKAIADGRALRGSELWSWTINADRIVAVPFGQGAGDETESNAAQLWSTASLSQ